MQKYICKKHIPIECLENKIIFLNNPMYYHIIQ